MLDDITKVLSIDKWILRVRIPEDSGQHPIILLLHGWTGDENAMWVFASQLPKDHVLIAPRGIFTTPLGGYGWHEFNAKAWPWVDDFMPAIESLIGFLTEENFPEADFILFELVGFSQVLPWIFISLLHLKESMLSQVYQIFTDGVMRIFENIPHR
jgi:hypothetical protein